MVVNTHYRNNLEAVMQVGKNYTDTEIKKSEERILSIVARNNVDFIDHTDEATYRFIAPLNSKLLMLQSIAGNSNKIAPSTPSDDSVSRLKTIPENTYKSQIDYIGGKTVKYNQLVQNGNFESASGWSGASVSSSNVSNNVMTFTQNATATFSGMYQNRTLVNGHKYFVSCYATNKNESTERFSIGQPYTSINVDLVPNVRTNVVGIITALVSSSAQNYNSIMLGNRNGLSVDITFDIEKVITIDLTDKFGAGNEPSDVATAIPLLKADGYKLDGTDTYSLPTIRDTKVSEIKANKNLYIVDNVSNGGVLGDYTVSSYSASSSGITISNRGNSEYNRVKLKLDTVVGKSYTFIATASINTRITIADNVDTLIVNYYNYNGTNSITFTATTTFTYVYFYDYYSTSPVSFTNITVFKDEGDLVKQIPLVVQQLDGYGCGLSSSLFNYLDLISLKFKKYVIMVDLSTLTWTYHAPDETRPYGYFESTVSSPSSNVSAYTIVNAICSKYSVVTTSNVGKTDYDKTIAMYSGNVFVADSSLQSTDTPSGLLVYELATPVETDISSYIDSDFKKFTTNNQYTQIEFVNEHNADMPNKVEFYGTIIHSLATAVKQEGFNLFDKSTVVNGKYYTINGEQTYANYSHSDYIEADNNNTYYVKNNTIVSYNVMIVCFDSNKNPIGYATVVGTNYHLWTLLPNTTYIILNMMTNEVDTQCINISNQDLNGTYKPYKAPITRLLPNSEAKYSWGITDGVRNTRVFCDDECNPVNEGQLDVGNVDYGSFEWTYESGVGRYYNRYALTNPAKPVANNTSIPNAMNLKYTADTPNATYNHTSDKIFTIDTQGRVYAYDSLFVGSSPIVFQSANVGNNMFYELATTNTETLDDFDFSFDCEEGDTFTIIGCELLQCYATYSFLIKEAKSNE